VRKRGGEGQGREGDIVGQGESGGYDATSGPGGILRGSTASGVGGRVWLGPAVEN